MTLCRWSYVINQPKNRPRGQYKISVRFPSCLLSRIFYDSQSYFFLQVHYTAFAVLANCRDTPHPVAMENIQGIPGLMTVISRSGQWTSFQVPKNSSPLRNALLTSHLIPNSKLRFLSPSLSVFQMDWIFYAHRFSLLLQIILMRTPDFCSIRLSSLYGHMYCQLPLLSCIQ